MSAVAATAPLPRPALMLIGAGVSGLVLVLVVHSLAWVGRPFPGFFVLENRVVPSIALPDWPDVSPLFQQQVVAVDGQPVTTSDAVYAAVRAQPLGAPIAYALRAPDGARGEVTVASREFTWTDWVFLFGSLLLAGGSFLAAGLLVLWLQPRGVASLGLLSVGLATGFFGLTALDLYGPHWFFRLHVVAEVMLAPAFIHLALVFPTSRLGRRRGRCLAALYGAFGLFAIVYQGALFDPGAYTRLHLLSVSAQGLAGAALIGGVFYALLTSPSALARRRLAVVGLGALSGFLVPTLLMTSSGLLGGRVAINGAALTAFFFPLALAYAILKQDLFEIDVALRRAITYGIVAAAIALLYFLILYGLGVFVPGQFPSWSPVVLAALNLVLLFGIASMRERVQRGVDRLFFRQRYRLDEALTALGRGLASTRTPTALAGHVEQVLAETIGPRHATLFIAAASGALTAVGEAPLEVWIPDAALQECLAAGGIVARYDWEDAGELSPLWARLDAEILVPLRTAAGSVGMLVLGPKRSRRAYSSQDIALLGTAADQVSLALANAIAYGQLADSLDELQAAYRRLEQSQASLLRADRLATLGRLTAGIAHEMNTPLSAVMNALKVLSELGKEYAASVRDPEVEPEDHLDIAREIVGTADSASAWASKAATFISSVKAQGREVRAASRERFQVATVVADVEALLAHRLRAAECALSFSDARQGSALTGPVGHLGQVLLNLCTNAIDAYEDAGRGGGPIRVAAHPTAGGLSLSVADEAGGIPVEVLPRLFEELFTTKGPGRGTGLGLSIARNLVEQSFGGTLTVETRAGAGSTFTAVFPHRNEPAPLTADPAPISSDGEAAPHPHPSATAHDMMSAPRARERS